MPNAHGLGEAVRCVIQSNIADGYTPNRFIHATSDGTAPDLLTVCVRLINRGETLEYLENALRRFPTLLTLEDFVLRRGQEWGFDDATIETARGRCVYFDQIAGSCRYT
jgi:hypothetical protein